MKKNIINKHFKSGFIMVDLSSCWTRNSIPILFKIKRLRKRSISDGYVCIGVTLFFMISIHIAWKGKII